GFVMFFFDFRFLISRFLRTRRTEIVMVIKFKISKIDRRFATFSTLITFRRLTRATSTAIAGIGFQLVFWFVFIPLTPH
ncbi:hypothetical protein Q2378_25730, partial [Escherichia coli]|nr:hypothetical protein [Escherichia coli]